LKSRRRLFVPSAVLAVAGSAVLALAASASAEAGPPVAVVPLGGPVKPATRPTGRVVQGTIRSPDGAERSYRLYLPSGLPRRAPLPLLVALHGGGGSAEQFERDSGFDGLAQANRFIVVYPDGTPMRAGSTGRVWNAGGCCGIAEEDRRNVDDVGFISALVAKLEAGYPIDRRRVFVAGHSNGAMLAFRLACQLSSAIAAIGVQSGTLFAGGCRPAHPVAVLEIHGTADENVPINGGRGAKDISGSDFPPPLSGLELLASRDHCPVRPTPLRDRRNRDLSYELWRPCEDGSAVEWVKVAGANHVWMGHPASLRSQLLIGKPYMGLDSSAAIWSFLAAHPRPSSVR
jgi:polyhydroxybutyrate depolymerase